MASQQLQPLRTHRRAFRAASLVLAACLVTPALANTPKVIPCPETHKASLEIPHAALAAKSVNHEASLKALDEVVVTTIRDAKAPSMLLAPRAEDAIRAAFAEESRAAIRRVPETLLMPLVNSGLDANDIAAEEQLTEDTEQPVEPSPRSGREMHTRLPGISDAEFARHKKQMFRRDI